jgi:hypothetical protein
VKLSPPPARVRIVVVYYRDRESIPVGTPVASFSAGLFSCWDGDIARCTAKPRSNYNWRPYEGVDEEAAFDYLVEYPTTDYPPQLKEWLP